MKPKPLPYVSTTLRVPRELLRRLRLFAADTATSQQDAWIEALRQYLARRERRAK